MPIRCGAGPLAGWLGVSCRRREPPSRLSGPLCPSAAGARDADTAALQAGQWPGRDQAAVSVPRWLLGISSQPRHRADTA